MERPEYATVSVVRFTDLIGVWRSIPSDKSLSYFRTIRCADELIFFLGRAVSDGQPLKPGTRHQTFYLPFTIYDLRFTITPQMWHYAHVFPTSRKRSL